MEDKCSCGNSQMFGSWMCKTCHASYMKTGVDPSELPKFESVFNKSTTEHLNELLGLEVEELETTAKPKRYNNGSIEVWDAIHQLQFDYFQGAVTKYIARYHDKNGPEDLVKAINYCIKMISIETGIDYYELHKLTPEQLGQRIKK